MRRYWVKNLFIVILGAALVYQTGMLWFDRNIGQTILYNLKNAVTLGSSAVNAEESLFLPQSLIAGYGDKSYRVIRSEEDFGDISRVMDEAVDKLVAEGDFEEVSEADWNKILESKCLIYKFPAGIYSSEYFDRFGKRTASRFANKIESFDFIIISAQSAGSSHTDFYFVDSLTAQSAKYVVEDNEYTADFYDKSEDFRNDVFDTMPYISSIESGFRLFRGNAFIPQWEGGGYYYNILYPEDPFAVGGQFSSKLLDDYTSAFFGGFSAKRLTGDPGTGTYVFSDDNVVVKYYKTGLMEYFNYGNDSAGDQTVPTALFKAKEFLDRDTSLKTGYFLTDIKVKSEGLVFYFDYEEKGFPIELSEEMKEEMDIEAAIEVTVKNNDVKKYRRYMRNFNGSSEFSIINTDFTYAMDNAVNRHMSEGLSLEPEELYLAYSADGSDMVFMSWYAKISGIKYKCEAFSPEEQ